MSRLYSLNKFLSSNSTRLFVKQFDTVSRFSLLSKMTLFNNSTIANPLLSDKNLFQQSNSTKSVAKDNLNSK
jgi:hypothetical protein